MFFVALRLDLVEMKGDDMCLGSEGKKSDSASCDKCLICMMCYKMNIVCYLINTYSWRGTINWRIIHLLSRGPLRTHSWSGGDVVGREMFSKIIQIFAFPPKLPPICCARMRCARWWRKEHKNKVCTQKQSLFFTLKDSSQSIAYSWVFLSSIKRKKNFNKFNYKRKYEKLGVLNFFKILKYIEYTKKIRNTKTFTKDKVAFCWAEHKAQHSHAFLYCLCFLVVVLRCVALLFVLLPSFFGLLCSFVVLSISLVADTVVPSSFFFALSCLFCSSGMGGVFCFHNFHLL